MNRRVFLSILLIAGIGTVAVAGDDYREKRLALTMDVSRYARADDIVLHARVLGAMSRTPRHEFVPEDLRHLAYANQPLPIGHGQTISQPYIVALMSNLLQVEPGDTVLEVGTGSGYQAAVLADMGVFVQSIEIVAALAEKARDCLSRLDYHAVTVHVGDGYLGLPDLAPFDGIIVTAAPDHVPQPLLDQLKPDARLVIPVGPRHDTQDLRVLTRAEDGGVNEEHVVRVRFVPLVRE
jgi:protein-L-isoaspartate(D-aspartate) O-methyltransferase